MAVLSVAELASFGAPPELVSVWSEHIEVLTDVQEKAVRSGALDGHSNLLVMAPTSSGKTLVGELTATSSAYTRRRHAIFIVPFRALADEHYDLLRTRYSHLLSVVISTADWNEFDADIRAGNFNLAVMTYEKLVGLLAQQPDLLGRCTALVVDEVQLLADGERGARLEFLLTQVMRAEDPPQLIALSASLDEVNGLDVWLKASVVSSLERPVPLAEYVCAPSGSAVTPNGDGTLFVQQLVGPQADADSLTVALAERFVTEGKQVIIFRTTIRNVEQTAQRLRSRLPARGLSQALGEQFNELEDSDSVNQLRLCLTAGVGFHTADLTYPERHLVESTFRSGDARILVATSTVAMGVNLPGDVVIVSDTVRFAPGRMGWERHDVSVAEYRNAAGRAGRLGQRTEGLAVLVAQNSVEQRQLVNFYLFGHVEPVGSQIPKRPFADVVFDVLCARLGDSEDELVDFITSTFAYQSFYERAGGGLGEVRAAVAQAVSACVEHGLVVRDGHRFDATPVARVLGAAGLSLAGAAQLASVLEEAAAVLPSRQDLIFEIASCDQIGGRPWLARRGRFELPPQPHQIPDGTDSAPGSRLTATLGKSNIGSEDYKALVRAKCLIDWMGGTPQREISAAFPQMGVAAARVRELGKNAAWLFDALASAAEVSGATPALLEQIRALALEARYGLPAPLAPLARLRVSGLSRERLLSLYQANQDKELYDPLTILDAPDDEFAGLLTPPQLDRLRSAILADFEESIQRKRTGHVARAEQTNLPRKLIEQLYTTTGQGLEQAVVEALTHAGLSARRLLHQPNGEEDIQVTHADGTVIISVTASKDDARPIAWSKVREILGAGAGINPVNYVCIGRPSFHSLAERKASDIALETGARSLLLIPIPAFADALLRIAEGSLTTNDFGDLLARRSGILTPEGLPATLV